MSYALKITGKVLPNQHQTESTNPGLAELDKREPVDFTIPTPIPSTIAKRPTTRRNGAIDGNWNKVTHTYRRNRPLPHQMSVPLSMVLHLMERFNLYMIVKPLPNYYVSHHIHFKHIAPFYCTFHRGEPFLCHFIIKSHFILPHLFLVYFGILKNKLRKKYRIAYPNTADLQSYASDL
jgi:hypothetical protein